MALQTLAELAVSVRSKNAGPFWVTIDIFLPDDDSYHRAAASSITEPATLATLYGVDPGGIKVFRLPHLQAIKVSFPRPAAQGSGQDRDMHAGQQFVPLLSIGIP